MVSVVLRINLRQYKHMEAAGLCVVVRAIEWRARGLLSGEGK